MQQDQLVQFRRIPGGFLERGGRSTPAFVVSVTRMVLCTGLEQLATLAPADTVGQAYSDLPVPAARYFRSEQDIERKGLLVWHAVTQWRYRAW